MRFKVGDRVSYSLKNIKGKGVIVKVNGVLGLIKVKPDLPYELYDYLLLKPEDIKVLGN